MKEVCLVNEAKINFHLQNPMQEKYYKQVYNLNITEKYEQDIIGLLNTATI